MGLAQTHALTNCSQSQACSSPTPAVRTHGSLASNTNEPCTVTDLGAFDGSTRISPSSPQIQTGWDTTGQPRQWLNSNAHTMSWHAASFPGHVHGVANVAPMLYHSHSGASSASAIMMQSPNGGLHHSRGVAVVEHRGHRRSHSWGGGMM